MDRHVGTKRKDEKRKQKNTRDPHETKVKEEVAVPSSEQNRTDHQWRHQLIDKLIERCTTFRRAWETTTTAAGKATQSLPVGKMLRNESNSYYGTYIRNKAQKPNDHEMQRLMTDRAAYLSYLEVQLERVSAACLVSQGFSERIEQQQAQIHSIDEKLVNLAKMIRLTKAFQEEEGKVAEHDVEQVAERVQKLEADIAQFVMGPSARNSFASGGTSEARIAALIGGAAGSVAGLTDKTPLQILHESAKAAASEALQGLPMLEQINQLSRKYNEHSLSIATEMTDRVKLRDQISELDQRITQLSGVVSTAALSAQKADEARNQVMEERLQAFERVVNNKVEASLDVLRIELEKKMNTRWEYIEQEISTVKANAGLLENSVAAETAQLEKLVATSKEEMQLYVERAVQAQQSTASQTTAALQSLRKDFEDKQTADAVVALEEADREKTNAAFREGISNSLAQLQPQVDQVQEAILALEKEIGSKHSLSEGAMAALKAQMKIQEEMMEAAAVDSATTQQVRIWVTSTHLGL